MNKFLIALLFVSSISFAAATPVNNSPSDIQDRIQPVGQVKVTDPNQPAQPAATQTSVATQPAAQTAAATSGEGKKIYDSKCAVCHASGVAGAPKVGDAAAWAPRVKQGVDALMKNVINGINAMPPKGTCMDCTDDQLKAAVDYMVDNSKPKS